MIAASATMLAGSAEWLVELGPNSNWMELTEVAEVASW